MEYSLLVIMDVFFLMKFWFININHECNEDRY